MKIIFTFILFLAPVVFAKPSWKRNALYLESPIHTDSSFNLTQYVQNCEECKFTSVGLPKFLKLDGNILKVIPPKVGVWGPFALVASDGEQSEQIVFFLKVRKSISELTATAKVNELFSFDLKPKLDANAPVRFRILAGPPWALITEDGIILGTPTKQNIGLNRFKVEAETTSRTLETFELKIKVIEEKVSSQSCQWLKNPIVLPNAKVGVLYKQALLPFVSNPDGARLGFSVRNISAPWFVISHFNGEILGTPVDVGSFRFTVRFEYWQGEKKHFQDTDVQIEVEK